MKRAPDHSAARQTAEATFASLKTERFGPVRLGGLRRRHFFDGDYERVSEEVRGQWRELVPMIWRIPKIGPNLGYSVGLHARDAMMALDFFCGFAVSGEKTDMTGIATLDIAPVTVAVFEHREHISLMPATLGHAFRSELPKSGLRSNAESPVAFVLRTLPKFNPLTGSGGIEILIPVKPH